MFQNRAGKKVLISVLSLLVLVFLAGSLQAKSMTLTLADSTAPVGLRGNGLKAFVEEVEKHTNGAVKIQVHWGGSLMKSKEILNGIRDGIVDIGYINANYYPKQMRINGAFALFPQGPREFTNQYWFYKQCFETVPAIKEELQRLKLKPIFITSVLPVAVVCTKPFTGYEDFEGKRIRASSRWWLKQLEAAGALPVSIPWGDCYMALQTGTIDGVYTNRDGEHRTKLDEVAEHVYTCRDIWPGVPLIYAINTDTWNDLSAEIQKQIVAAGEAAAKRFETLYEDEWSRVEDEQQKMGCIVTPASEEDIQKWVTMPIHDQLHEIWIKEAEEAGVENAAETMAAMQKLLDAALAREAE